MKIWAYTKTEQVDCPRCGVASARVHRRYERRLTDAAVGGQPVEIRLRVRQFVCQQQSCTIRRFAEQVPGLTVRQPAQPAFGRCAGDAKVGGRGPDQSAGRSPTGACASCFGYLTADPDRIVKIGRERLRQVLHAHRISFQHTRAWKQSHDPDFGTNLDRIEEVTSRFPDQGFAFDQFGPLSIRPCHGICWAPRAQPTRLPATYHRTHGVRYFHGCYSLTDDQLWGVVRERKGAGHI